MSENRMEKVFKRMREKKTKKEVAKEVSPPIEVKKPWLKGGTCGKFCKCDRCKGVDGGKSGKG